MQQADTVNSREGLILKQRALTSVIRSNKLKADSPQQISNPGWAMKGSQTKFHSNYLPLFLAIISEQENNTDLGSTHTADWPHVHNYTAPSFSSLG